MDYIAATSYSMIRQNSSVSFIDSGFLPHQSCMRNACLLTQPGCAGWFSLDAFSRPSGQRLLEHDFLLFLIFLKKSLTYGNDWQPFHNSTSAHLKMLWQRVYSWILLFARGLTKNSCWKPTPGLSMMFSLCSGMGHRKNSAAHPSLRGGWCLFQVSVC